MAEGYDAGGCCYVLLFDVFRGFGAGEDVELVFWDVVEGGDGEVEVLRQNGSGVVAEDLGCEEGVVFGEISVVEDEEELYSCI